MRTIQKLTGIFKNCPDNLETVCLKDYILAILPQFVICLGFTRICREIVDVAIYALYPESFCGVNLAIRKVFAFSDSGVHVYVDLVYHIDLMLTSDIISRFFFFIHNTYK